MDADSLPERDWQRLASRIAAHCGLNFPADRRDDLVRALDAAARLGGLTDGAAYAQKLLNGSGEAALDALVPHLTIGETYFFRERPGFDALASQVLPALIEQRNTAGRTLRLWSAACSTGEEAYSLAMLVRQLIPDLDAWRVRILATDINPDALRKAETGIFGEWSFRGVPDHLRRQFFTAHGARQHRIHDEIRAMVEFCQVNLATHDLAAPGSATSAMDLILCRNLLIYFTPEHARRLVAGLRGCLVENGWLLVGPSECSQELFRDFQIVNLPNAIFYRRARADALTGLAAAAVPAQSTVVPAAPIAAAPIPLLPAAPPPRPTTHQAVDEVRALLGAGRAFEAIERLRAALERPGARHDTRLLRLLTQALADQGDLAAARAASERWIEADRLDAAAHYFHALVLQELGERAGARAALQRAIYLLPGFTLAHVSLGACARAEERHDEARRHLESAARLLSSQPATDLVEGAEGMSVGRLRAIVAALLQEGRA